MRKPKSLQLNMFSKVQVSLKLHSDNTNENLTEFPNRSTLFQRISKQSEFGIPVPIPHCIPWCSQNSRFTIKRSSSVEQHINIIQRQLSYNSTQQLANPVVSLPKKTFFVTPLHPDLVSASPPCAKLGRKNEIHENTQPQSSQFHTVLECFQESCKKMVGKKMSHFCKITKVTTKGTNVLS